MFKNKGIAQYNESLKNKILSICLEKDYFSKIKADITYWLKRNSASYSTHLKMIKKLSLTLNDWRQPFDYFSDNDREALIEKFDNNNKGIQHLIQVRKNLELWLQDIKKTYPDEEKLLGLLHQLKQIYVNYHVALTNTSAKKLLNQIKIVNNQSAIKNLITLIADAAVNRKNLLTPKAQLYSPDIGFYYIDMNIAHQLFCKDEYYNKIAKNTTGDHAVAALNGVHYKPFDEHAPISPAREYAVYALHQTLAGTKQIAASSSMLKVSGVIFQQVMSPKEDSTQDIKLYNEYIMSGIRDRYDSINNLFKHHPKFRKLKTKVRVENNIIQASLTINGMSLKDAVMFRDSVMLFTERYEGKAEKIIYRLLHEPEYYRKKGEALFQNKIINYKTAYEAFVLLCKRYGLNQANGSQFNMIKFSDAYKFYKYNEEKVAVLLGLISAYPTILNDNTVSFLFSLRDNISAFYKKLIATSNDKKKNVTNIVTKAPELFAHLEPHSTDLLMISLLMSLPEDGKFDNFILQILWCDVKIVANNRQINFTASELELLKQNVPVYVIKYSSANSTNHQILKYESTSKFPQIDLNLKNDNFEKILKAYLGCKDSLEKSNIKLDLKKYVEDYEKSSRAELDHESPLMRIVGFDSDRSLVFPILETNQNNHYITIKNDLYSIPEIAKQPLSSDVIARLLEHTSDEWIVQWLGMVWDRENRFLQAHEYKYLQDTDIIPPSYDPSEVLFQTSTRYVRYLRDRLEKLLNLLKTNSNYTHLKLLRHMDPLVYAVDTKIQQQFLNPTIFGLELCHQGPRFKTIEVVLENEIKSNQKLNDQNISKYIAREFPDVQPHHDKNSSVLTLDKLIPVMGGWLPWLISSDSSPKKIEKAEKTFASDLKLLTYVAVCLPNIKTINLPAKYLQVLLHAVLKNKDYIYTVRLLLQSSACLEAIQKGGHDALRIFCLHCDNYLESAPRIANLLFEYGAAPNKIYPVIDYTPLMQLLSHCRLCEPRLLRPLVDSFVTAGADLDMANSEGDTLLDKCVSWKNKALFLLLVELGAYHFNAKKLTLAQKFINEILDENDKIILKKSNLYACNRSIAWLDSLSVFNEINPDSNTTDLCTLSAIKAKYHNNEFSFSIEPIMFPKAWHTIFGSDGYFRQSQQDEHHGKHVVKKLKFKQLSYHLKQLPEIPGFTHAIWALGLEIGCHNIVSSTLLAVKNKYSTYPILLSPTISSDNLMSVLSDKNLSIKVLEHIDLKGFSDLFVLNLLADPADGTPENYMITRTSIGYQLISIDNERYFIESIDKKNDVVNVKCILYCLPQMLKPIDNKTRNRILNMDVYSVLKNWLQNLQSYQNAIFKLFDKDTREKLYDCSLNIADSFPILFKNSKIKLPVLFALPMKPAIILNIFDRLIQLQQLLMDNNNISHFQLLSAINPKVGYVYGKAWEQAGTALGRFNKINFIRDWFTFSKTSTSFTSRKIGESIGYSESELRSLSRKDDDDSPGKALEILEMANNELGKIKGTVKAIMQGDATALKLLELNSSKVRVIQMLNFADLDTKQQKDIFKYLDKNPLSFRQIKFNYKPGLDKKSDSVLIGESLMRRFIEHSPNLIKLNLNHCHHLTGEFFTKIAKKLSMLTHLRVNNLEQLEIIDSSNELERLVYLDLSFNLKLKRIQINAPALEVLNLQGCSNLIYVSVNSKKLKRINLENAKMIKLSNARDLLNDTSLEYLNLNEHNYNTIHLKSPKLQKLCLRNNKNMKNITLDSKHLKELDLYNCSSLSRKIMLGLLSKLTCLQRLNLTGCKFSENEIWVRTIYPAAAGLDWSKFDRDSGNVLSLLAQRTRIIKFRLTERYVPHHLYFLHLLAKQLNLTELSLSITLDIKTIYALAECIVSNLNIKKLRLLVKPGDDDLTLEHLIYWRNILKMRSSESIENLIIIDIDVNEQNNLLTSRERLNYLLGYLSFTSDLNVMDVNTLSKPYPLPMPQSLFFGVQIQLKHYGVLVKPFGYIAMFNHAPPDWSELWQFLEQLCGQQSKLFIEWCHESNGWDIMSIDTESCRIIGDLIMKLSKSKIKELDISDWCYKPTNDHFSILTTILKNNPSADTLKLYDHKKLPNKAINQLQSENNKLSLSDVALILADGTVITSTNQGTELLVLDKDCGIDNPKNRLSKHKVAITILYQIDGNTIASGSTARGKHDGIIKVWDIRTGECKFTLSCHDDRVSALCKLLDGRLVSGSWDRKIKIWSLESGVCQATLSAHGDNRIYALCSLPDGGFISGDRAGKILIWSPKLLTHRVIAQGMGLDHSVKVFCVLPNGCFASGCSDGVLYLWSHRSFKMLAKLDNSAELSKVNNLVQKSNVNQKPDWIETLKLLPNNLLVSGSWEGIINVWSLKTYQCVKSFQLNGHRITHFSYFADLNRLYIAINKNDSLYFWQTFNTIQINLAALKSIKKHYQIKIKITQTSKDLKTLTIKSFLNEDNLNAEKLNKLKPDLFKILLNFLNWLLPDNIKFLSNDKHSIELGFKSTSPIKANKVERLLNLLITQPNKMPVKQKNVDTANKFTIFNQIHADKNSQKKLFNSQISKSLNALTSSSHYQSLFSKPNKFNTVNNNTEIKTLGDGNCLFNAVALGLRSVITAPQNIYSNVLTKFIEMLKSSKAHHKIKSTKLENLLAYADINSKTEIVKLLKSLDNDILQQIIAPLLREKALETLEINYAVFQHTFESRLLYVFQNKLSLGGNDISNLSLHNFIVKAVYEATHEKALIQWWRCTGKEQYFKTMKQPATDAGDKKRWGGECELTALALFFNINIRWSKFINSNSVDNSVGVLGGVIQRNIFTKQEIQFLMSKAIIAPWGENHLRFELNANENVKQLPILTQEEVKSVTQQLELAKNSHNYHISALHSNTCKKLSKLGLINEFKNWITRNANGDIDFERIESNLIVDINLVQEKVAKYYQYKPVSFAVCHHVNHWSFSATGNQKIKANLNPKKKIGANISNSSSFRNSSNASSSSSSSSSSAISFYQ